jgi:DNA mismatch repair protein MutL
MSKRDAALAIERHATSKIASEEDLATVRTLGFRGEALPSIASVARFTLTTSDGSRPEGTRVTIEYGAAPRIEPAARPRGTDVLVEDLFGRTPARRKFLKTPEAEAREIARAIHRAALARPEVAFSLRSNGKEILAAPSAIDRAARAARLFGADTLGELLPFQARAGALALSGLVTRGSVTFATRRLQFLHVNGRAVEDRGVSRAIAGRRRVDPDRPASAVFLYLDVPDGSVDVNVSPSRRRVRFAQPSECSGWSFTRCCRQSRPAKRSGVSRPPATDFRCPKPARSMPPRGSKGRPAARLPPPRGRDSRRGLDDRRHRTPPRPAARALAQYDGSFLIVRSGGRALDRRPACRARTRPLRGRSRSGARQ